MHLRLYENIKLGIICSNNDARFIMLHQNTEVENFNDSRDGYAKRKARREETKQKRHRPISPLPVPVRGVITRSRPSGLSSSPSSASYYLPVHIIYTTPGGRNKATPYIPHISPLSSSGPAAATVDQRTHVPSAVSARTAVTIRSP